VVKDQRLAVGFAAGTDSQVQSMAGTSPLSATEEHGLLIGEMLRDDSLGGGVEARVGDLIEPFAELRVEIIEVTKAAAEEEVPSDVTKWAAE
jgi:hypothetical protein